MLKTKSQKMTSVS